MGTGEDYNQNIISRHRNTGVAGQGRAASARRTDCTGIHCSPWKGKSSEVSNAKAGKDSYWPSQTHRCEQKPLKKRNKSAFLQPLWRKHIKSETVNDFSSRISLSSPCGDGHSAPLPLWYLEQPGIVIRRASWKAKPPSKFTQEGHGMNSEPNCLVHCYPQPDTRNWQGHTTYPAQTHCSQVGDIQKSRELKLLSGLICS